MLLIVAWLSWCGVLYVGLVVLVDILSYVLFGAAHGYAQFSLDNIFKLSEFIVAHDLHASEFTLACYASMNIVAFVFFGVVAR